MKMTVEELTDVLLKDQQEELAEQIYEIENFIFLFKGIIEKIIINNNGRFDLGYSYSGARDFSEEHVLVKSVVNNCKKYSCIISFTIECSFDNAADCRMATFQGNIIKDNISSERNYNPYLDHVAKYRVILTDAYKKALKPKMNITITDNLSIGGFDSSKTKAEDKSRMLVFCETVIESEYLIQIHEKNIDATVK